MHVGQFQSPGFPAHMLAFKSVMVVAVDLDQVKSKFVKCGSRVAVRIFQHVLRYTWIAWKIYGNRQLYMFIERVRLLLGMGL